MPVLPIEIPQFGGLDLRNDPQQIAQGSAIDMLNVELDNPGRLRARDGYAKFTTVAAASPYFDLKPFYVSPASGSNRHIVAMRTGAVDAINTSGAVAATLAQAANSLVQYGGSAGTFLYAISGGGPWGKWDGTTWTTVASMPFANQSVVQSPDNRLVVNTGSHRVQFSDPGAPETYGVNNWVDLTPGDGDSIVGMAAFREMVFVFKENKFFVFTGNETDGTGNPVFRYRAITTGVGALGYRSVAVAPGGVYFLDRTGIYLTAGGPPTLVSSALSPLFAKGALGAAYTGSAFNWTPMLNLGSVSASKATLNYFNGRLYLSVPTGVSTVPDRTFVLDLETNQWMVWDLKVSGIASFRVVDTEEMFFALSSGSNDIARYGPAYTADAGAAIASKYRTGFFTPAVFSSTRTRRGYPWPGAEGVVREWLIDGQGTVNIKTAYNDSPTLGAAAPVVLATAPATAQGRDRRAVRGRNVSVEISAAAAPWQVSRMIANIMDSRGPGLEAAA